MKRFLFLGAALIALLPLARPGAALAQTTPPPVPTTPTATATGDSSPSPTVPPLTAPEVIVTATRIPEPAADSASSVTVVTRQQIEENQYQNVAQALEQVPGVEVETAGSPGQLTTLIMRGAATNENLILVDGKRLPEDFAGGFDLTDLTLDNVERIEVVRGALSGVQGGSAMGGVINIITRDGKGLEKPEYSVSLEAGSYSTIHDVVTARGAKGPFDWSVAVSSLDTQNQRANNDYDLQNYTGNAGWQISKELRFTLATTHRLSTAQNPATSVSAFGYANDPSSWQQIELWSAVPELEWKTTEWWTQTLSYQRSQYRVAGHASLLSLFTGSGDTQRTQIDDNRFDYDHLFRISDTLAVTAGTEFSDQKAWQADDGNPIYPFGPPVAASNYNNNQTNTSGYLGTDWQPLPGWKIDPSFRIDHYSDFGTFANWRFASSYRVEESRTLFHGSYGTATTAPAEQNYLSFGGTQLPNLSLKPEQSKGFDAGVEQPLFKDKVTLGATYFQNHVNDLISSVLILPSGAYEPYNVNEARMQGVETSATWHPLDQLDVGVTYTYTDAEDLSNNRLLARRPRNVYTFNLTERPIPGVSVAWSGSALNGEEDYDAGSGSFTHQPGYFTSRVAASWQAMKHLQVFGRIENVFNEKYTEVAGYPTLDQGFYGGLKLDF